MCCVLCGVCCLLSVDVCCCTLSFVVLVVVVLVVVCWLLLVVCFRSLFVVGWWLRGVWCVLFAVGVVRCVLSVGGVCCGLLRVVVFCLVFVFVVSILLPVVCYCVYMHVCLLSVRCSLLCVIRWC